jgi:hypothetical protein
MEPTNRELYDRVKREIHQKYVVRGKNARWNAHLSQLLVKTYKQRGGKYRGRKSEKSPLATWTRERWSYVPDGRLDSKVKGPRYLPMSIIRKLTPQQRKITNRNKRLCKTGKCDWEPFVLKHFRALKK